MSPPETAFERQVREICQGIDRVYLHRFPDDEEDHLRFFVTPEMWPALKEELCRTNVKCDCHYDARAQTLIVKNWLPVIGMISNELSAIIDEKLVALVKSVSANSAVRTIFPFYTYSRLGVRARGYGYRTPDFSIWRGEYPASLHAEFGHSREGVTNFDRIADIYIRGTRGAIKTFIGLDIEHRTPEERKRLRAQPREATYQIYRSSINDDGSVFAKSSEKPVFFQDAEGVISPNAHLRIDLTDLTRSTSVSRSRHHIKISHLELCNIMEAGEAWQEECDNYQPREPTRTFIYRSTKEKKSPPIYISKVEETPCISSKGHTDSSLEVIGAPK